MAHAMLTLRATISGLCEAKVWVSRNARAARRILTTRVLSLCSQLIERNFDEVLEAVIGDDFKVRGNVPSYSRTVSLSLT